MRLLSLLGLVAPASVVDVPARGCSTDELQRVQGALHSSLATYQPELDNLNVYQAFLYREVLRSPVDSGRALSRPLEVNRVTARYAVWGAPFPLGDAFSGQVKAYEHGCNCVVAIQENDETIRRLGERRLRLLMKLREVEEELAAREPWYLFLVAAGRYVGVC